MACVGSQLEQINLKNGHLQTSTTYNNTEKVRLTLDMELNMTNRLLAGELEVSNSTKFYLILRVRSKYCAEEDGIHHYTRALSFVNLFTQNIL